MTLNSGASNVLLARCRARYGRRLTAQNIEALAGCRTVADCAAVLRTTRYAGCIASLGEGGMYRRPFEAALNDHLARELDTLSRCEWSVGDRFADYLLMRREIGWIMQAVRRLVSGGGGLPRTPVSGHGEEALLSQCEDYDGLLEAVRHSRFGGVLKALRPLPGNRPDSALIEHSLYDIFFETLSELISHYPGSAGEELKELVGTQIDSANFCHIYRLKKYYGSEEAAIRSMLVGPPSATGSRLMRRMTAAPDAEAVRRIFLEESPYRRHIHRDVLEREGGLEAAARLLVLSRARRLMHSSVPPSTVLLAYILMAEAEVRDLITIVEGVYYGLPREEILSLITINELTTQ